MNAWTDVSEVIINKWAAFTRAEVNVALAHPMTVSLEEINKQWDRPANWAVTISEHDGHVLMHKRFYLNVDTFSAENAQKRADELVAEYWNPKPVVAVPQFTASSDQALLTVQEKNYGSTDKKATPTPTPEIVVDTEDAFIKHLASKVQVAE
jgi:hypothetical protein